jgi:hypothetical protein
LLAADGEVEGLLGGDVAARRVEEIKARELLARDEVRVGGAGEGIFLREVRATLCFFMTRMPRLRWPASRTSSGSPIRTFAVSSDPERAIASAMSAPPLRARSTTSLARSMRSEISRSMVKAKPAARRALIQRSAYPRGPPATGCVPKSLRTWW